MKHFQNKTLTKPFPNKTRHEAFSNQNLLDAVRLMCYCDIVLSPYLGQFPNKTLMKQSGYCVIVLLRYRVRIVL